MFITEYIIQIVNFSRKIIKPEKMQVIITYSNDQNIQHSAR